MTHIRLSGSVLIDRFTIDSGDLAPTKGIENQCILAVQPSSIVLRATESEILRILEIQQSPVSYFHRESIVRARSSRRK